MGYFAGVSGIFIIQRCNFRHSSALIKQFLCDTENVDFKGRQILRGDLLHFGWLRVKFPTDSENPEFQ